MSIKKLIKEISKLVNEEASINNNSVDPGEIYLISDSKGKYLKPVIPGRYRTNLHIINKSGATIDSEIVNTAIRQIRLANKPTVLIWLGTCEITSKKGKFIQLIDYPFQTIEEILDQYWSIKKKILRVNSQATVCFLECPYFSISIWNKYQGRIPDQDQEGTDKKQGNELKSVIEYFNQQLSLLNASVISHIPKLSKDQIISSKKKRLRRTKYKINYKLLYDGVHPSRKLARLWLHRIIKFSREVRNLV